MTNAEFQKHLKEILDSHDIIGKGNSMTVNELLYLLRMDKDVSDYNVNLVTEDGSVSCIFSVKQCFVPVKSLALHVKKVECDEFDWGVDETCLIVHTEEKPTDNTEWFGIVRWCKDDLISALTDRGYPATEHNIATLYNLCNQHWFTDNMIETGWEYIYNKIDSECEWDEFPKEE